jgi:ribonuclease J
VDRLTTLYHAAAASGRDFIVSTKTAHLLSRLAASGAMPNAPIPGTSPGLKVYHRSKRRYFTWERPFLDQAVDAEFVRTDGPKLLLSLDLAHFAELIDLRPPRGAPFIHSMSEPFSEEDVDDVVLHHWIDHFGLAFHQMHASGHCSATELGRVIGHVDPKVLFPIHTLHPESFLHTGTKVISPRLGDTLVLPT